MDHKQWLSQLTLEEKAGLCSGKDFWTTKEIKRLGIPSIRMSDGPHGLRKREQQAEDREEGTTAEAVCFPCACATACSFDRALLRELGEALGKECQAQGIDILLGPGVNIKRSPLCGRNFEYFSEDPFLSSQLAASFVQGVQGQGVGTSLKHYLANNQEHRRLNVNVQADERTLREIYLASFETAVKEGQPWTVMCSYNRVNGTYASENEWSLSQVLREEWGFAGAVVSDWGAVSDRVAGLAAGLDLEMPGSGGENDNRLVQAVREGRLDERLLDQAVERVLSLVQRAVENRRPGVAYSQREHHELARRIEAESMVLLKNENVLPLHRGQRLIFLGGFAEKPRFQGGGSSHVNACQTQSAWQAAKEAGRNVCYLPGFDIQQEAVDEKAIAQAVRAAQNADAAVIFAGLPEQWESEGKDRTHLELPACQNALIEAVGRVQPKTVVVLHNGAPVTMPWLSRAGAVLEAYLGGQAVGGAVLDVLLGEVNPSGKLAESFPKKLSDNPSYLNFPGEGDVVRYQEGIFVGYRYYDKKEMEVLFPFGHGLSYTSFAYRDIRLSTKTIRGGDSLTVSVRVQNTGSLFGKEVVQLYIRARSGVGTRPEKELKGFEKLALSPRETKEAVFALSQRAFAHWDKGGWRVETGVYQILAGGSSRSLPLCAEVFVEGSDPVNSRLTRDSTVEDFWTDPKGRPAVRDLLMQYFQLDGKEGEDRLDVLVQEVQALPLRTLVSFSCGRIRETEIQNVLERCIEIEQGGSVC